MRSVSGMRSSSARAVTISETKSPAPCSRQSMRKAELVIPAIGARTTGGSTKCTPSLSGSESGSSSRVDVVLTMLLLDQVQFALAPLCRDHESSLLDLRGIQSRR